MKKIALALTFALALFAPLAASGPANVYAIVEKVVFEPNDANPERIQIWGAFSFLVQNNARFSNGVTQPAETTLSAPMRGYLYFSLPPDKPEQVAAIRAEWKDLKAIAGTGQAVAFGEWFAMGSGIFGGVPSGTSRFGTSVVRLIPIVVETATPPRSEPPPYVINAGLVKLTAEGSHSELVKKLRDALAAK
jgi:hypothetical protein